MQNRTRSLDLWISFECQVPFCTSCKEHQIYITKCIVSAAVSGCCKRMQNIPMLYLNWQGLLYWEFLLSQWELGDIAVKPSSKDCPVNGALSTSFASSTVNFSPLFILGDSHVLTSVSNQHLEVVSHLKQIPSTIPFHQIKVKLNINEITSVLCFPVRICAIRPTTSYLLKNKQKKLSLPPQHRWN